MESDEKLVVTIPYYGTAEAKKKSQELQELYIKLGYSWYIHKDNEPRYLDKPYIVLDKDCKRFYFASYLIGGENLMDFDIAISEAEKQLFNLEASNPVKLKPLDKVYYPSKSNLIYTCSATSTLQDFCEQYPIDIEKVNKAYFTIGGMLSLGDSNPSIFPATLENYKKLRQVYPNLQKPELTDNEICMVLLQKGYKFLICSCKKEGDEKETIAVIVSYYDEGIFVDSLGNEWDNVSPLKENGDKYTEQDLDL